METLYTLRPEFRDIVVEGHTDQHFYEWYVRQHGINGVKVYAVDDFVEIDGTTVLSCTQEIGARGRVISLAMEASKWGLAENTLTMIVDADRDCLTTIEELPGLLRTDVGSLEVYMFQERPLQKLLSLVLGSGKDARSLIDSMTEVLNQLFICRHVLHIHGPCIALLRNVASCLTKNKRIGTISLDYRELIRRSLDAAKVKGKLDELVSIFEDLLNQLPEDRLRAITGHDLSPTLIAFLDLKNNWASTEVIEATWRGCVEVSDLDSFPMFVSLRQRVAA